MARKKIIIMGAAGRDFHNFNVVYRCDPDYEVVAFTAAQIPGIDDKRYPASLAGPLYSGGIPIVAEKELPELVKSKGVDSVVFAYSDVSHEAVMHKASIATAAGADFQLLGPGSTMLRSKRKVISVCAVRTGCGKSQTSRKIVRLLREGGKRVAAVRHPMPYGDLETQKVQRFSSLEDFKKHRCTIEEMEEYEPYVELGASIFAGVDYADILSEAEKEADVILWDGGNNDFPFYRPDLEITVVDPLRPGHELTYYPGETNLRRAHVVVVNKINVARKDDVGTVRRNILEANPGAIVIEAESPVIVDRPEVLSRKRVLIVEDGPTLTHGGMKLGAGTVAAKQCGASEIVDPRPWLKGSLKQTFKMYPDIGPLLPAMGYGEEQTRDLEDTIRAVNCDAVVIGTPIDLSRIIRIEQPSVRVRYELREIGEPNLETVLRPFLE